jgi:hypothetical protein
VSQNAGAELQPPFGTTARACVCSVYFVMLRRTWMRRLRNLTKSTCPYAVQVNYPSHGNKLAWRTSMSSRACCPTQIQMVCERPPAAYGGSPPHGGGDSSGASEGVAHTPS